MKKKIIKLALISFCFFISCKSNEENKFEVKNVQNVPSNVKKNSKEKNTICEIYIGKIFFSGDELNDFTVIENKNIKQIDSLSYSIYKKNGSENYVFSLEKFLKNEDVEKYEIIDTVNSKYKNLITSIKDLKDFHILELKTGSKLVKKWEFRNHNASKLSNNWSGVYEGTFLRLKEESGDPRSRGHIKLEIKGINAKLNIDSYVENVGINLKLIDKSSDELKFKEVESDKTILLKIKSNKILIEGNLFVSIVGTKEIYEIEKVK